jgi:hypothetical protein
MDSINVPEGYEKCFRVSSSVKGKYVHLLAGESGLRRRQLGGGRMNPGIRIVPLSSTNGFLGGRMSG